MSYKLELETVSNSWHDKDYLILQCCFALLVDFVEQECAQMEHNFTTMMNPHPYGSLKYKFYNLKERLLNFLLPPKILAQDGIKYLLRHEEEIFRLEKKFNLEEYEVEELTWYREALCKSKKLISLYEWWINRESENDKIKKFYETQYENFQKYLCEKYNIELDEEQKISFMSSFTSSLYYDRQILNSEDICQEEKELFIKYKNQYYNVESVFYNIDTDKLKQLMDLRDCLWT